MIFFFFRSVNEMKWEYACSVSVINSHRFSASFQSYSYHATKALIFFIMFIIPLRTQFQLKSYHYPCVLVYL